MINQPTTSEPGGRYSFIEGMEAFDVAGEKVGSVSWQNPEAGYLVIQKGWLFANELYVPYSYIVSQDNRGLFLNLSKEDLKDDRWKVPPTQSEMAAAASQPIAGSTSMGGVVPAAPAFSPAESSVQAPAQPETSTPTDASAQDEGQPLAASSPVSDMSNDGWPVENRAATQDAQPAAVDTASDAVDSDMAQSSTSADALDDEDSEDDESLQADQPVDVVIVSEASDAEPEQIDQPDPNLSSDEQSLQAEQPVEVYDAVDTDDVEADTDGLALDESSASAADLDTADPTAADLTAEEQPLQTAGVGTAGDQQTNDLEQRVLYRMEGAAAGVAAAQAFKHTGAAPEDTRSGAAMRAALLVGFDVALKHNAAQQLSEPGPRGSSDPVASLLAEVGPAETPELAPLLAAAWRAALAVASDNPSAAPEVRAALERLARD